MSIQALREQRAAKAKELHELVNKKDWNAAADQPVYDAGMAAIDGIDAQIRNIEEVNKRLADEALTNGVIVAAERIGRDQKSEAAGLYAKWLRGGVDAMSAEELQRFRNTMSTTTNSEGGYTVQTDVARSVLDALKAFGGMRSVATIIQTSGVGDLNYPTSDGTSETGEIIGQNTTATAADVSFGVVTLKTYKFSSKIVAVPFELLQDSNVDIEAFVRARLATRLGRITNTKYTTGAGSGSNEPNGIVTAASSGKVGTTGQTTTVIYNDLVDLQHSVDPAYREGGRCKFMMNDASLKVIRKIVDGQSRPIFVPGYEQGVPGGAPATLLGAPVVINQDVATMAANAKSILYGDFSEYVIRDVMDVTMFRFTDSAYAKLGQVGFLAWLRTGGNLIDVGGAVKYYANSAT
jgi:HK97 family phage major capsid protein